MKKNIKTILVIAALFILIIGCGSNNSDTAKTTDKKMDTDTTTATRQPSDTGWTTLFDSISLSGWRTYQNKKSDSWSVQDGSLHCIGSTEDKSDMRADLITNDEYENFDLLVDWKISPKGNSGIMYMVTEKDSTAYKTGPEYQIIDDKNFPEKLEDWQKTGANYAMNPAPTAEPKPVGEWNHTEIIVNKGHVEHWLNGKKIVEYELWSDEWKANKAKRKWKDAPDYGMSKTGHIALQDHGSEAWFRNIKIRKL